MLGRKFIYILICVLIASCSKKASSPEEVLNSTADVKNNKSLTYLLKINIPAEAANETSEVVISSDRLDEVRSVSVKINGKDVGRISQFPYKFMFNPSVYTEKEVVIEATGTDFNGGTGTVSEKIIISGSSVEKNCMTDDTIAACIFNKNPVAQNKSSLSTGRLIFGRDLTAIQTFPVQISGLTNPSQLKNASIDVVATNGARATPINGKWKFPYQTDTNHKVAQVMAYYWLNKEIDYFETNAGVFYAKNKNIKVDAYNASVRNNAYYDGSQIVMGDFNNQEASLSAEIYIHEMGHANLDHATNGQLNISSNQCPDTNGCIGGIHEGQADLHSVIMFPTQTAMAETVVNSMAGWSSRDVKKQLGKNKNDFGTEVHSSGTAYATALYKIYSSPEVPSKDFEKMFTMHLSRLTSNSNYIDGKNKLIQVSDTYFAGKYSQIIQTAFASMGF